MVAGRVSDCRRRDFVPVFRTLRCPRTNGCERSGDEVPKQERSHISVSETKIAAGSWISGRTGLGIDAQHCGGI